jgi:hypothetical protein
MIAATPVTNSEAKANYNLTYVWLVSVVEQIERELVD